jgi:hypothetical protein
VRSHDEGSSNALKGAWPEWDEWWRQGVAEALLQQREASEWWGGFLQCWLAGGCGPHKALALGKRLMSAAVAACEAGVRLAVDQQRQSARLFLVAERLGWSGSPAEAQMLARRAWCAGADMTGAWEMIQVSAQARVAAAWAEFWSSDTPKGRLVEEQRGQSD